MQRYQLLFWQGVFTTLSFSFVVLQPPSLLNIQIFTLIHHCSFLLFNSTIPLTTVFFLLSLWVLVSSSFYSFDCDPFYMEYSLCFYILFCSDSSIAFYQPKQHTLYLSCYRYHSQCLYISLLPCELIESSPLLHSYWRIPSFLFATFFFTVFVYILFYSYRCSICPLSSLFNLSTGKEWIHCVLV